MTYRVSSRSIFSVTSLVFLAVFSRAAAQPANPPKPLQISMANTFVHDRAQVFIDIATSEFKAVMKNTTGLDGELTVKHAPADIAAKLHDKQLDFAILYAHEYAWVREKYPDLKPLLIAATKKHDKRVHVIVHQNCAANTIADLRGQKFDMPSGTKEYCRIYLDKLCADQAPGGPVKFFGTIAKSSSQLDALDEVARKKADATIVDTPWLDFYKEIKGPVFAKNLKVLLESKIVPPAVVVYRPGKLGQKVVDRVSEGLRKVHTDVRGQALMMLWHIDSFEAVPEDYSKSLAEVLKQYPAPMSPR